jgi:hypothetical protein
MWTDRTVPADGLTTNERLRRLSTQPGNSPMTGASGIAQWASAEITSLCAGLSGILDPAVLHDVADLVDHAEPGIALDLLCDKLLDAKAPLDVAQRVRLLTVGRAMGLDETVAFLGDAPAEG